MRDNEPHDWSGDQYHCQTCWRAYHCPVCSRGVSMMGHGATDDDGFFYTCQEAERAERWRSALLRRLGSST